jgi:hypothetical protein
MNKLTIIALLVFLFTSFSAEARVIRVTGYGKGGTTEGDKRAACNRAYDRAEYDAESSCYRRYGNIIRMWENGCSCRRKQGGTNREYVCEAKIAADCDTRRW